MVFLHHICCIGEEEVGVGLQMYKAFVGQKPAIPLHEECRGEALMHVLHLRVGERQPYLLNLVGSKKRSMISMLVRRKATF